MEALPPDHLSSRLFKTRDGELDPSQKQLSTRDTQVVSASSAGIRALLYQFTYLYLRNPAKLFRPARFDYLVAARALMHGELARQPWSYKTHSSIAVLYRSILKEGWYFVPRRVLPPLIANSAVGLILYSTYLTCLQYYSGFSQKRITDPHPFDTFRSGFIAGAVSSLVASPLDALYSRSAYSELVKGKENTDLWKYAIKKLRDIGPLNFFSGFGLNFVKESTGFAVYFALFEVIKNQGYHLTQKVLSWYDHWKAERYHTEIDTSSPGFKQSERALQLSFVLLAGATAACGLIAVQYPLSRLQRVHMDRLEAADIQNEAIQGRRGRRWLQLYHKSYFETIDIIRERYKKSGLSLRNFVYKGFLRTTLTSVPATSTGLLVFEISRQQLSGGFDSRFES
ncbi:DEKNAAC102252 [Brettanomyces naardenensis]|uniref:DEKNAAC102252 n=1 Tax=Brettanomyces naardenensis TaxID=13370 RepID=A0A448YKV4_BRENA|nr:DEKNAAC102252 [Brettanomyces naardenensis]